MTADCIHYGAAWLAVGLCMGREGGPVCPRRWGVRMAIGHAYGLRDHGFVGCVLTAGCGRVH
jgi:hypothetical protein